MSTEATTATGRQTAFVLVVEDEEAHGEAIAEGLRRSGHACHVVSSVEDAIQSIRKRPPDVIVTDYRLAGDAGPTGLDVLREAKRASPTCEVILITAYGNEQLAREALGGDSQTRAFDYLTKPVDLEDVREVVNRAAQKALANREARRLSDRLKEAVQFDGVVAGAPVLQRVLRIVRQIAPTKITALVLGETGTGKELIARAIHANSTRKSKPYKIINCAGLNENLLESELFGHVRGSFTGAISDRKGLLEAADGGTVFLDEVGDMPLTMQAKLLRVLESGEVLPVGSNETRHTDVRVIAATHRDLRELIKEGKFREDLYYRLNQVTIRIPPLRERREDIPLLIQHFIQLSNTEHDRHIEGITPEAIRLLVNQRWEGNVRQLKQVITQMVVLAPGPVLDSSDIPEEYRQSTEIIPVTSGFLAGHTLEELEKVAIQQTLKLTDGNREKAAKLLGIGARTLYRKLREYNIE
jgi:two-component system, NtrC family, response regulator HydG